MERADVAVVGAGPAGAAAAVTAARAGLRVVVIDKATFPRDKCCGDGLTTGALRRLEGLGVDPRPLPSWQPVSTAWIRVPDGRSARFRLPPGPGVWAATVRRVDLDAALVATASDAGASVWQGRALAGAGPAPGGAGVDLVLDDGEVVRAWYAIGADGAWSPLRKAVGAGEAAYVGEWHAARRYLAGTGPAAADLWVWFEDDIRPGYAWSFPLPGGGANVGYGIRRSAGSPPGNMARFLDGLLTRAHIAAVLGPAAAPEAGVRTWPIPARIGATRLCALSGRVMFAGDAARAADPMTGEGIAQALETGELAAATIAAFGPRRPGDAGRAYAAAVARGMRRDDALAARLSRVLAGRRGVNRWLDVAVAGTWGRDQFTRWMFEDYPRALVFTPWRWERGALRRPAPLLPPAG